MKPTLTTTISIEKQKLTQIRVQDSPKLQLAEFIRENISKSEAFVLVGYDWTSEIAYYAERYAVMIPDWVVTQQYGVEQVFEEIFAPPPIISDRRISIVILCNDFNNRRLLKYLKRHLKVEKLSTLDNCTLLSI